jgi:hypothetical protein
MLEENWFWDGKGKKTKTITHREMNRQKIIYLRKQQVLLKSFRAIIFRPLREEENLVDCKISFKNALHKTLLKKFFFLARLNPQVEALNWKNLSARWESLKNVIYDSLALSSLKKYFSSLSVLRQLRILKHDIELCHSIEHGSARLQIERHKNKIHPCERVKWKIFEEIF